MKRLLTLVSVPLFAGALLSAQTRITPPDNPYPLSQDVELGRKAAYLPGGHAEGYPDTFVQLFRDFYGYLDAGDFEARRPFPTFANGNHELLLCEAIAKSAHERAWVPVHWD